MSSPIYDIEYLRSRLERLYEGNLVCGSRASAEEKIEPEFYLIRDFLQEFIAQLEDQGHE